MPKDTSDYDAASPEIQRLLDQNARFVAVSGIGLLSPGSGRQLNDGGPSAARTAIGYNRQSDQFYVFQGGNYTPDNMQDLFRGLGADTALLLDGGGSSAIILRRDTGGMWAGAGGLAEGQLRYTPGAVRIARARAAELAGVQLSLGQYPGCPANGHARSASSPAASACRANPPPNKTTCANNG